MSVGEIAAQIKAKGRHTVNGHSDLRRLSVSVKHFQWNSREEQGGTKITHNLDVWCHIHLTCQGYIAAWSDGALWNLIVKSNKVE